MGAGECCKYGSALATCTALPNSYESAETARWRVPVLIGLAAAAVPLLTSEAKWLMAGSLLAALAIFAVCLRPNRWLILFFAIDILTPPLGGEVGSAGIHLAMVTACLGLLAGLLEVGGWHVRRSPLLVLFAAFAISLLASLPFALLYSGPELAINSAQRIALFLIGVYVFCYTLCAPAHGFRERVGFARVLFILAVVAA